MNGKRTNLVRDENVLRGGIWPPNMSYTIPLLSSPPLPGPPELRQHTWRMAPACKPPLGPCEPVPARTPRADKPHTRTPVHGGPPEARDDQNDRVIPVAPPRPPNHPP